jgi:4-hydroxy-tetrahydrodipicolinate synthase
MTGDLVAASPYFNGLWLPLITPMRDGAMDIPAVRSLVAHYVQANVSGLVLFGTTGEGSLLTLRERIEVSTALRDVAPSLRIIIGIGGVDTHATCLGIRKLEALEPAGWLVAPPYYLRPAAEGILWHYRSVAWATQRPIIIYNVPKRTGIDIDDELLEQLCAETPCVGVKECDADRLGRLSASRKLLALCGEDSMLLHYLMQGGIGAMAASAHVRPDIFLALMELVRAGELDQARALFAPLQAVIKLLFEAPNPAAIKKVLAAQGLIHNELRLPLTPASDLLGQRLMRAINRLPSEQEVRERLSETRHKPISPTQEEGRSFLACASSRPQASGRTGV